MLTLKLPQFLTGNHIRHRTTRIAFRNENPLILFTENPRTLRHEMDAAKHDITSCVSGCFYRELVRITDGVRMFENGGILVKVSEDEELSIVLFSQC